MKHKSTVLLGVLLIVSAVVCGCGDKDKQQQETTGTCVESGRWTTKETVGETIQDATDITTEETITAEETADITTEETVGVTTEETTETDMDVEDIENAQETTETATEETQNDEVADEMLMGNLTPVFEEIGLQINQVEIDLASVQNPYELLFVNDMHVLTLDESVVAESQENVRIRQDVMFRTRTGMSSADAWRKLSSVLDDFSADGIILGGDMMDFMSPANTRIMSEGLAQITTPYIYLRADHDMAVGYSGGSISMGDSIAIHTSLSSNQDMFVMEYPEFYVLGWNNSTSQLTEDGLDTAWKVWSSGKPIILATHVPINSIIENSLADAAANTDPENRKKLWGQDCLYRPDANTGVFLGMIYDANSPVKAVLSGHLHFFHEVQLTEQTREYVFAPAFEGNIAKIVIK